MVGSTLVLLLMGLSAAQPHLPSGRGAERPFGLKTDGQTRPGPRAGHDPLVSPAMRSDARLADVCFTDPQHGWAVGDRGAIWHTADGGRTWGLQESSVACPLRSVCFVNEETGWAVGGYSHPYTHTSSGEVLLTRDGGRTWHHNPKLLLPALRQVRFFDARQGWAVGCSSAMFPAGVFVSRDGGRDWMPPCGGGAAGWLAADFLNPSSGILAGRDGAAVLRGGEMQPGSDRRFALHSLRRVQIVPPVYGWLVGDGGLVMLTTDLGASWQPTAGPLPGAEKGSGAFCLEGPEGAAHKMLLTPFLFDFAALAVRGPKCWIAGTPGSRVFHSADAGRTWTAFPTGCTLPIEALAFADDLHGWAVGALGTILATDDGGRTWRRQRAGGGRAALLGMFARAEDVPLELLARLSGSEGYLSAVEVLGRSDVEIPPRDESHLADRLHEAVVATGGNSGAIAWRFPLRQMGVQLPARAVVEGWDRINDGRGLEALQLHAVRLIRTWRPDVIVTGDESQPGEEPAVQLMHHTVAEAVARAADPAWMAEPMRQAGLGPWQVKKVYAALPPGVRGPISLTTTQLSPRLGRSLADAASLPRGLLEDRLRPVPVTLGFRPGSTGILPVSGSTGILPAPSHSDFFTGIALPAGGEARRAPGDLPAEGLELLERMAQRRRHVQAILDRAEQDPTTALRLLAQTDDLTRGLDTAGAAQVIYGLADRYARSGHGEMAAETFQLLTERYPDDPLARPALTWLVQYYAGSETAHRAQSSKWQDRLARAAALGRQIEPARPELFAEPALRFPLAAALRQQGQSREAERLCRTVGRGPGRDPWSACAQGELWLAQPKGPSPKTVLPCVAATERPRLDGVLDDAVWQRAKPAALASTLRDDAAWPATVMLAHDAEFLYVAIRCRLAPGARYEPAAGQRPRDGDLSAHDRVDILLDLDRDYATYYRLTIDHRGWTGDSCWGDRTWDPTWYVAARTADGQWTAEAAIPLDQLSERRPAARTVWAIGIQRTVPGVGFQSWTAPASISVVPEGFGYLLFE